MAPARPFYRTTWFKIVAALVILGGIGTLVSRLDFSKDLRALNVRVVSGAAEGNYFALVAKMAALAEKQKGKIDNVASQGSIDNLARLQKGCEAHFGLSQAGQEWPARLELIGRLPRAESVFFLGKDADKLTELSALKGSKIGIGPESSGTAKIAKQIFAAQDLRDLQVVTSHHTLAEQVELAASGALDLAVFVMDQDGPIVTKAIREKGLQIAGFTHAEVLASKVPPLSMGRIPAGYYDAVKVLPAGDKPVLQIATYVVGNGCASRSATVALLSVLDQTFPDFLRFNKTTPNTSGLEIANATKSYLENEGPDPFDEYAPWLVDIMPPGKWVYLITALSILFNIMGFGNRFQLWRIDAERVKIDAALQAVFGGATVREIERLDPKTQKAETIERVKQVIKDIEALAAKSRKQSLSILVPMGGELTYRYQESLMFETIAALRAFLKRLEG